MMKRKNIKRLTLFALLGVPTLVFLLLKYGGQNYYDLPVFDPEVPGCELNLVDGHHQVPNYTLTDAKGSAFSYAQDLKGKIHVVGFFSTGCQNNCLQIFTELERVQDALELPDLQLLTISTDPKHDTPEKLRTFASEQGITADNWHILTGEQAQVQHIARCGYFSLGPEAEAYSSGEAYGTHLVLVDKEGKLRGFFEPNDREEIDRLIIEIQILKYQDRLE